MSLKIENLTISAIKGLKITVMGLGLNGGGLASALFFASKGAEVTVTDLRDEKILAPSIDKLKNYNIRFVLGRHDIKDFENADIVIKNPAVRKTSPYLEASKIIETDLSIFMRLCKNRTIAVTGSKGKSTTVSAVYHTLKTVYKGAKLGGNITTSPLSFIDDIKEQDPLVLELSSWQLADLKGKNLLSPHIALITNILPDHQNSYNCMDEYVDDKKLIYKNQDKHDFTLCSYDDDYGKSFYSETEAVPVYFSSSELPEGITGSYLTETGEGFYTCNGKKTAILDRELSMKGRHNRLNLLTAAAALYLFGIKPEIIRQTLSGFKGIPDRMEFVSEKMGISFYNDTTATIPEAVAAAVSSFENGVRLIAGGTDKELDFKILSSLKDKTKMIYLLEGSGTDKIIPVLNKNSIPFKGPYSSLSESFNEALSDAEKGDNIIMSPGCASFGMFKNEFERGETFRELVKNFNYKL
jgi:UDP-N-acetylmuramoylalanine--D-glutamate ligase